MLVGVSVKYHGLRILGGKGQCDEDLAERVRGIECISKCMCVSMCWGDWEDLTHKKQIDTPCVRVCRLSVIQNICKWKNMNRDSLQFIYSGRGFLCNLFTHLFLINLFYRPKSSLVRQHVLYVIYFNLVLHEYLLLWRFNQMVKIFLQWILWIMKWGLLSVVESSVFMYASKYKCV